MDRLASIYCQEKNYKKIETIINNSAKNVVAHMRIILTTELMSIHVVLRSARNDFLFRLKSAMGSILNYVPKLLKS